VYFHLTHLRLNDHPPQILILLNQQTHMQLLLERRLCPHQAYNLGLIDRTAQLIEQLLLIRDNPTHAINLPVGDLALVRGNGHAFVPPGENDFVFGFQLDDGGAVEFVKGDECERGDAGAVGCGGLVGQGLGMGLWVGVVGLQGLGVSEADLLQDLVFGVGDGLMAGVLVLVAE
jgi:hypothetical protein